MPKGSAPERPHQLTKDTVRNRVLEIGPLEVAFRSYHLKQASKTQTLLEDGILHWTRAHGLN